MPASSRHDGAVFVPLPENRSARRAVHRWLAAVHKFGQASPRVSPLFLFGGPGTGKSLLLHWALETIARQAPQRTAQLLPAKELAEIFLCRDRAAAATPPSASASAPSYDATTVPAPATVTTDATPPDLASATPQAIDSYSDEVAELRDCDALLIDDLHQFPPPASEALIALLDRRKQRRQATLLTANVGPAQLDRLPHRLTNRLAAGLVVALEPWSATSREKFLRKQLQSRKIDVDAAGRQWLLTQFPGGGARPILGLLNALEPLRKHHAGPLTAELLQRLLPPGPTVATESESDLERIVRRVAQHYRLSPAQLRGPSRLRPILQARQLAIYLARQLTGLPLAQIGRYFGNRDHTTILHACQKIEAQLSDDPSLAHTLRHLRAELS